MKPSWLDSGFILENDSIFFFGINGFSFDSIRGIPHEFVAMITEIHCGEIYPLASMMRKKREEKPTALKFFCTNPEVSIFSIKRRKVSVWTENLQDFLFGR